MAKAVPSVLGSGYSGSSGSVTFVRQRSGGTLLRVHTSGADPATERQRTVRDAMARANALFRTLDRDELLAWKRYAAKLRDRQWADGRPQTATGVNAFRALTCKALLVDMAADPPRTPPTAPFVGDAVQVTATAGAGGLVFGSVSGNADGVLTELFVQRLTTAATDPVREKYRHAGFVAFPSGGSDVAYGLARGWYAAAYRFVLAATGQMSDLAELEPVQVV